MSTESVPLPEDAGEAIATPEFCETVARELGIKVSTIRTAFIGEPIKQVMGVIEWCADKSEDPDERAKMLIGWAKKRKLGAFRVPDDQYISLAGSVGHGEQATDRENAQLARHLLKYWNANPKRLAKLLTDLEIWLNIESDEFFGNGGAKGRS